MSGGQRYWNEDAQRWEDGAEAAGRAPVTPAPVTPPPASPPPAPIVPPPSVPPSVPPPDFAPGGGWSSPELPHPGPQRVGGLSRRTLWTVLGGAAVAGAAVALVLTLVVGDGNGDGGTDGKGKASGESTAPVSEAPPEGDASPPEGETPPPEGEAPQQSPLEEPPSPSATVDVPAGYELYEDAEGFSIARPTGWTREAVDSQYGMDIVNYRSADGELRLQVFEVAETSPEASFDLFLSDDTPKADGFEELTLEQVGEGGSRLEYLADSIKGEPDVGTWHVVDERFVAADGNLYAVAAYGPDADGRDDERELLDTALTYFCPPYYSCD
ncbi:hypothetical protein [Streptomyces flavalbus]|uniref:Serine/arginine repetitive matrix protein 2 n=1 Tax=Streptomyces flavalbus TaxID=2665155 RepID=A0ABW2WEB1_9ACTN